MMSVRGGGLLRPATGAARSTPPPFVGKEPKCLPRSAESTNSSGFPAAPSEAPPAPGPAQKQACRRPYPPKAPAVPVSVPGCSLVDEALVLSWPGSVWSRVAGFTRARAAGQKDSQPGTITARRGCLSRHSELGFRASPGATEGPDRTCQAPLWHGGYTGRRFAARICAMPPV